MQNRIDEFRLLIVRDVTAVRGSDERSIRGISSSSRRLCSNGTVRSFWPQMSRMGVFNVREFLIDGGKRTEHPVPDR